LREQGTNAVGINSGIVGAWRAGILR
jgi:hypothetical protein